MRHTRNHRRAARFPILPCTGMGLSSLHCYLWSGELLPPLFTLTSGKPEAVIFCDTIRHARLPSRAPLSQGFLPYGVRTFLSSPKEQANAHTPKSTHGTVPSKSNSASGKFATLPNPQHCKRKKARTTHRAPRALKQNYTKFEKSDSTTGSEHVHGNRPRQPHRQCHCLSLPFHSLP